MRCDITHVFLLNRCDAQVLRVMPSIRCAAAPIRMHSVWCALLVIMLASGGWWKGVRRSTDRQGFAFSIGRSKQIIQGFLLVLFLNVTLQRNDVYCFSFDVFVYESFDLIFFGSKSVAIAASYARAVWGEKRGVRKIAILDFDVHHGNGTEDIVRSLVPSVEEHEISTPLFTGTVKAGRHTHTEMDLGMLRSDSCCVCLLF